MAIKTKNFQRIITETFYLFIISFFCYATTNKLMNLNSFRTNLLKTSLFSEDFANAFSIFIIVAEIFIILLLIFYKKIGLLIFSFTILLFTLYISYLRFNGLYEICGCGGILNGLEYKYHFLINIGLFFGSVYCFLITRLRYNEK
jgi:hypothetical protein